MGGSSVNCRKFLHPLGFLWAFACALELSKYLLFFFQPPRECYLQSRTRHRVGRV